MKINLVFNPALESLFKDPSQLITFDANLLISPTRFGKSINFEKYKTNWLDPIFDLFPNISIHEAVYEELVNKNSKDYIDSKSSLRIHRDSSLTPLEKILRNTIES